LNKVVYQQLINNKHNTSMPKIPVT